MIREWTNQSLETSPNTHFTKLQTLQFTSIFLISKIICNFFFFHKHVKRCELEFRWTMKAVSCGAIFNLQFYVLKNYFLGVIKILLFFVPQSKVAKVINSCAVADMESSTKHDKRIQVTDI